MSEARPTIRRAEERDLPAIVALMVELAENAEPGMPPPQSVTPELRRAFGEIAADPRQQLLVVEDARTVVGTATLVILPDLSKGGRPRALVESVCVTSAARGRGYGELLMQYCVAHAQAAGCFKLALTSNQRRLAAHRFYERLGFHHTHRGYTLHFLPP